MCGIVGIFNIEKSEIPEQKHICSMLSMIQHRGPDHYGIYLSPIVAMGSARLSIIDLGGGQQPIHNEDKTLWIVFNGEIFNYIELRSELESQGHTFSTHTDTEVIIHLYEEYGLECLNLLNGQFAIAIWDENTRSLLLARDRLGIRPLYYTIVDGLLVFGSEMKAIACHPSVRLNIDPVAIDQTFTFWATLPPTSIFKGIREIPPGSYFKATHSHYTIKKYWEIDFPDISQDPSEEIPGQTEDNLIESFRELLIDSVKVRLRADVPVGAYLSGGLDSSLIAFIIRQYGPSRLDTFSISFDDNTFDESVFQKRMAKHLGTDHQVVRASYKDIGKVFPDVVWHTETPVLRTAPAPMFLLSQLVQKSGYKVVLTGEGADEFFAGYDIFKEAKIRRFWARQSDSKWRPLLFGRLYKDIPRFSQAGSSFASAFFKNGLTDVQSPHYSHAIRWRNTRRTQRFFSKELANEISGTTFPDHSAVEYPPRYGSWGPLEQSQYLEISTFMSPYLLSSQGDRMAMAHSVEGRYPFLDYRVVDFCNRLPANLKLHGLRDKYLLRKCAKTWLPAEIWQRPKRPYRAPIHRSFFNEHTPDYVNDLLSPTALAASGLFNPDAVGRLIQKIEQGAAMGETEEMALTGIISSQLLYYQFVTDFPKPDTSAVEKNIKVCRNTIPIES